MKEVKIKLSCGRLVTLEGFTYDETYAGLIHGSPNQQDNTRYFERANYPDKWGKRPVLKLRPREKDFNNRLKPACYSAMLISHEPKNPKCHGSELVVIWFGDEPGEKRLEDIVYNGIKSIDWDSNARDFCY